MAKQPKKAVGEGRGCLLEELLATEGIEVAVWKATRTQLDKSTVDATALIRGGFAQTNWHDYESQGRGSTHKVFKHARVLGGNPDLVATISLFRPPNRGGDPRLCVYRCATVVPEVRPGCSLAIVQDGTYAVVLNLDWAQGQGTSVDDVLALLGPTTPPALVAAVVKKLRAQARQGPLPAVGSGDPAVGEAVEALLGIKRNPRPEADLDGQLEFKATTQNPKKAVVQIFGGVPSSRGKNWLGGSIGSYRQFCDEYGYPGEGCIRHYHHDLYAGRSNSHGLQLRVNRRVRTVEVRHEIDGLLFAFDFDVLEKRLGQKHPATLWIDAGEVSCPEGVGGRGFCLLSALHTTSPDFEQFLQLVEDGTIRLSLGVKQMMNGKYDDYGVNWRIKKQHLSGLFRIEREYPLR